MSEKNFPDRPHEGLIMLKGIYSWTTVQFALLTTVSEDVLVALGRLKQGGKQSIGCGIARVRLASPEVFVASRKCGVQFARRPVHSSRRPFLDHKRKH